MNTTVYGIHAKPMLSMQQNNNKALSTKFTYTRPTKTGIRNAA